MHYISTRGGVSPLSFTEAVMMGLGTDGGLLLPNEIPKIDQETFDTWQTLPYPALAFQVMSRFIDDIPASELQDLVSKSYASFSTPAVAPLVDFGDLQILELFHGPTLAFKDVALQFLGNLFEYLLDKNDSVMNILGATSGDTGSAAIYGVRGKARINIFILHPLQRISPVQEKQMTTVTDANVFNIAIRGSFDDGQAIVKEIFNELPFKNECHLGAINSINWARVLAQVVYYVRAVLDMRRRGHAGPIDFSVPTGNFGDIFAGFIAKQMVPEGAIRHLVLATNANDILSRLVNQGDYSLGQVVQTSSPSMDIQAASNFERYLYYLTDCNALQTKALMEDFLKTGRLDLSGRGRRIQQDFLACAVSEESSLDAIYCFMKTHDYTLDPHTAVGVHAALKHRTEGIPMVCLATAHPAKFGRTVERATGMAPARPEPLVGIEHRATRCETMDANTEAIKRYVRAHARHGQLAR
ncbi:MAG: threonine synthase [Planctomycetes bacterium]|nr:threonine synthase [Planctomycetota bacterium]